MCVNFCPFVSLYGSLVRSSDDMYVHAEAISESAITLKYRATFLLASVFVPVIMQDAIMTRYIDGLILITQLLCSGLKCSHWPS